MCSQFGEYAPYVCNLLCLMGYDVPETPKFVGLELAVIVNTQPSGKELGPTLLVGHNGSIYLCGWWVFSEAHAIGESAPRTPSYYRPTKKRELNRILRHLPLLLEKYKELFPSKVLQEIENLCP